MVVHANAVQNVGEIIGNGCTCERCPDCGKIIGNGCTCERCPECGELASNCSCNPNPKVYGSDILVSGGFFYDMDSGEHVENTEFNGIYHLVDVTATGFSKIWKHETLNYWIFYCSQTWSGRWRFTPDEPDGWDSAGDFLITEHNTTKWPWEDDTWRYNAGYNESGYIIPKIYGGPNAGD